MSASDAHLEALASCGYTPQEAHFLYLVATHSGYFLARQFLAFTRGHWGSRTHLFWRKLRGRMHCRSGRIPGHGIVHQLFSAELYRLLGRENLSKGREHELDYVYRRIAVLDFVLSHPELNYLETEPEKRFFFEHTCNIPAHLLPSRTHRGTQVAEPTVRYFVDRFPMYFEKTSCPAAVTFSYIQPCEANLSNFARYLGVYLPLFRELPAFRFVYLARSSWPFEKALELFDSRVRIPLGSNPVNDLLRYFAVRRSWDLRQFDALSEDDLIFRNKVKDRFIAARFERLYRAWSAGRIGEEQVRREFPPNAETHDIQFSTELLKAVGKGGRAAESNRQPEKPVLPASATSDRAKLLLL
jgi:hypothetical protein